MKVALVTGAAAGIGAAIAKRLARDDIAVAALDLTAESVAATVAAIAAAGGKALAVGADIADRAQVTAAVEKVTAELGPIAILVNNAGITGFSPFLDLTDAAWDRMLEVNLKGTFIVTQCALPSMIAAGWGRIVNISSSSAQSGAANMAHYSSSKGAMIALTKSLAQEFGPKGITVNNIPPRFIMNTVMSEKSFTEQASMAKVREQWVTMGPVPRQGEPEDIAGACAYLASDEAGYVTGQTIGVNGGRYI